MEFAKKFMTQKAEKLKSWKAQC